MASLTRLLRKTQLTNTKNITRQTMRFQTNDNREIATGDDHNNDDEEFRVLNLRGTTQKVFKKRNIKKEQVLPPRNLKMPTDQDWTAVWPGPRTFHPATVPLPVRQGYTVKGAAPPSKYANAELMKIPNFLHLTPPAIQQQCEAIKKFCTQWPKGLETEEKMEKHFPIEISSTDYCHGLPTIRQPDARIVTLKLKLSNLKFDAHAKDKFLRLVGERYNEKTDELTIVADRCPLRKQNYDYAMYVLTACYFESYVMEPWEGTKEEADMEYYHFERNKSKESCEAILNWGKTENEPKVTASEGFIQSLERLINEGENEYNLKNYKKEVLKMLGLEKQQENVQI